MSDESVSQPREGSSLYYSLLWVAPEARERFISRLSLIDALATTLEDVQEPTVAQQKIHWWHEELDRAIAGNARHPIVQACQTSFIGNNAVRDACLPILSVASTLRFTPCATDKEASSLVVKGFQARLALLGHALTLQDAELEIDSHPQLAALGFGLHDQLNRLPKLIHRGLSVFSHETYDKFNIRPDDLARHIRVAAEDGKLPTGSLGGVPVVVEVPQRAKLIQSAIAQVRLTLQQATSSETIRQRYRQADVIPLWRLLILKHHQAKMWEKQQPDLLRERMTLTPLKKLYRAWQHRR